MGGDPAARPRDPASQRGPQSVWCTKRDAVELRARKEGGVDEVRRKDVIEDELAPRFEMLLQIRSRLGVKCEQTLG